MKKPERFIIVFFLVLLYFFPPLRVLGEEITGGIQIVTDDSADFTNDDKAMAAGEMLSSIISLITNRYAGPDASPENLYEAAIRGMMEELDPYSVYFSPEELKKFENSLSGNMYGIGVSLELTQSGVPEVAWVLKDSPAEKVGIKKGDRILQIDGKDIKGQELDKTIALITASDADTVLLKIQTGAAIREVIIEKAELHFSTVLSGKFEDLLKAPVKEAAAMRYVSISAVGENTAKEFQAELKKLQAEGVKRIVLDLRGNPGGYMDVVLQLSQMIVPKGPILYTVDREGNKTVFNSTLEKPPFEKIVVLTDNGTASAAEVLASALQDAKAAVIVGETTFGKGVIQSLYRLPTGGAIKMTTEKYLRRSGEEIDKIGVVPDTPVKSVEGSDAALKKAYEVLKEK